MQKPLKILVIMTKKIGDTLICTPLLSAIKKEHSNAEIDFLAKYPASEILERNPDINQIYIINKTPWLKLISEIRKKKYDFIIDLYPTLKMWPAENWKRLAELIIQKYSTKAKIFIFIDKNGQDFAKRICPFGAKNIFIPQCENLTQLSSYISFLNLAVTVCTGTKHIAIALNVPTITIQTITNPNTWHPAGNPKHRLVSAQGLDCLYCDKTTCNPMTAPCLLNLKPELVFNELTNLL